MLFGSTISNFYANKHNQQRISGKYIPYKCSITEINNSFSLSAFLIKNVFINFSTCNFFKLYSR